MFLLIFFTGSGCLYAQTVKELSGLNYTYLGPVFSIAHDKVEYKDWFETEQGTKNMSGLSLSGGLSLLIFVESFCGDFQIKYTRSSYDFSLDLLEASLQGKYLWGINNYLSAGTGLGLYSSTALSNSDHKGSAGFQIPLSAVITLSDTWKVFFDVFARYGSFGMGEGSTQISFGTNLGLVYRVGRI
jgi:hypothetical protein